MGLILPQSVWQRAQDSRARYERAVLVGLALEGRLEEWNRELRQIDPYLQMVRADPDAAHPALRPGFYHLLRRDPTGAVLVLVVGHRDGSLVVGSASEPMEFCEPTSALFDELRRSDMWSDRSVRAREQRQKELDRAKESRERREREDRNEEIRDRVKSLIAPGVSMAQAGPWANRVHAKKKRRG